MVNLRTGRAFEGVLWRRGLRWFVIRQATLHDSGARATVDGEVLVERSNIDFWQVLP